jgi:putative ABC transport system permease protein
MAPLRLHDRVYRALLALLPRSFRDQFGASMTEDFRDQHADAGARGASVVRRLWARTLAGLVWLAGREHVATVRRDLTHAGRLFLRRRAFTATIILTLAAGIGVTTATFSIVHAIVLQRLPGQESDRLVRVFEVSPAPESREGVVSNQNFVDWKASVTTLDGLALYHWHSGTVVVPGLPAEHLSGLAVSDGFMRMLGLQPLHGRLFAPADFAEWHAAMANARSPSPRARAIILSEGTWHRLFGGRLDVVGTTVSFDDGQVEIIGILPSHPLLAVFPGGSQIEYWAPGGAWSGVRRRARVQRAIGRLAPGVPLDRAQAEFDQITQHLESAYPDDNKGWTTRLTPFKETVVADVRAQLWLLFGVAACVLVIATLNVARLFATFNAGRRAEFLTRMAIGASKPDLARLAITETLLLCGLGGGIGMGIAYLSLPALMTLAPVTLPRLSEVSMHGQALAAGIGLILITAIASGVASSLTMPTRLVTSGTTEHRGQGWWRTAVLATQVGLALTLAIATALLVRSMQHIEQQTLGFVPDNVLAATIAIPTGTGRPSIQAMHAATQAIIDRVEQHPGVVAAATGGRPLGGGGGMTALRRPDQDAGGVQVGLESISDHYFEVLGVGLESGRWFSTEDTTTAPKVALLNGEAARQLGFGTHAVGQRVLHNNDVIEIVGVVANIRHQLESAPPAAAYLPVSQSRNFWSGQLLVRTAGSPASLKREIQAMASETDPRVAAYRLQTLDDRFREVTAPRRFLLRLVTMFSVLAIGLAVIGLAGVMAEAVEQRVREIGIRMALGARPGVVVAGIVRYGLRAIVLGLMAGGVLAYQLRTTLEGYVFGVPTHDGLSFLIGATALLVVGTLACYLPARRAAAIDPVRALRSE